MHHTVSDTNSTNGNTHGQQSAAKGRSTTVTRSDIRSIQHLGSSAHAWFGPEVQALLVALNWLFPYPPSEVASPPTDNCPQPKETLPAVSTSTLPYTIV
jgi:hypothetical protein